MYSITDRGPNQDCGDLSEWRAAASVPEDSGKAFPLERFAPTVTELSLYKRNLSINRMTPLSYKHVRDHVHGAYATGKGTKDSLMIYEGSTKYGMHIPFSTTVFEACQHPDSTSIYT